MDSLRDRVTSALGTDAVVTGWTYRLLSPDQADDRHAAVAAVSGGIGDRGNMRLLVLVDPEHLDPDADADALALLSRAPKGARLAYEIAYHTDLATADWPDAYRS